MLHRYWFTFEKSVEPCILNLGCGVTAIDEADAHDRKLGGTPPLHNDAQPPDGDDYNELWSIIETLRNVK